MLQQGKHQQDAMGARCIIEAKQRIGLVQFYWIAPCLIRCLSRPLASNIGFKLIIVEIEKLELSIWIICLVLRSIISILLNKGNAFLGEPMKGSPALYFMEQIRFEFMALI